MARKLRSALELVSDIGCLGFDLQHHSDEQIAAAVALLRTVNAPLFHWLVKALGEPVVRRRGRSPSGESGNAVHARINLL